MDERLITLQHQLKTLQSLPNNRAIDLAIADLTQQIKNYKQQSITRESRTQEDLLMLRSFSQGDFWELLSDPEFKIICLRFLDKVVFNGGRDIEVFVRDWDSNSLP
ncbi:MAG: hypothetical protein HC907_21590 [Richelia sp. SM1_7_0]|nr:hypothetical protein [Richelia sp. SM1_7_0]